VTELVATYAADGSWSFDAAEVALIAAAIPTEPPRAWFDRRRFDGPTPLTFTSDGQVYGHIADRTVPHIGLPGHRTAPKSKSGYSYYHTGQVRCDDGTLVSTGRITMLTGHADLDADAQTAAAHYDHTGSAVADVVAWDDEFGVAVAGAARPGTTAEQMRMAMASPPSGDWRGIGNDLEMVGALLVNVPGFPTPRAALAASGAVQSLVAAGVVVRTENPNPQEPEMTETVTLNKGDYVELAVTAAIGQVVETTDGGYVLEVPVGATDVKRASEEQAIAASAARTERQRMASLEARIEQLTASLEARDRAAKAEAILSDKALQAAFNFEG
jgi:hypothetical protein